MLETDVVKISQKKMSDSDVVFLNVGGCYYVTRRSTLLRSNSFFSGLARTDETELFVDRDPTHFRHILNWLRGVRYLPEDDTLLRELSWEADYYALTDLREAITRSKRRYSLLQNVSEISAEMRRK